LLPGLTGFERRQFKEPVHGIVKIHGNLGDEEAVCKVGEIFERANQGTEGTEMLLARGGNAAWILFLRISTGAMRVIAVLSKKKT
jgi:hypothetical protein